MRHSFHIYSGLYSNGLHINLNAVKWQEGQAHLPNLASWKEDYLPSAQAPDGPSFGWSTAQPPSNFQFVDLWEPDLLVGFLLASTPDQPRHPTNCFPACAIACLNPSLPQPGLPKPHSYVFVSLYVIIRIHEIRKGSCQGAGHSRQTRGKPDLMRIGTDLNKTALLCGTSSAAK